MKNALNELNSEGSLYLQQHANNPVHWKAFKNEAFDQAKKEKKLILISIGYSACHWCHVMEKECFEDSEVAELMNQYFVCIKVDREERPDVDQIYMTAVQLMTDKGGWPLNCFTLPNGKPVYGGTYFPKEQWVHILKSLVYTFQKDPKKVEEYAEELTSGIQGSELIEQPSPFSGFPMEKLEELVQRWSKRFDWREGGPTSAPKFPLPNNYEFLLNYGILHKDEKVLDFAHLTLQKMARGGIYDQIKGGFARYSVDMLWKVPHFEKMLYDNGQLLSLYAIAYQHQASPEYKLVLEQTIQWLFDEMLSPEGGLYSAIDADSEGEEGKYYCWEIEDFKKVLSSKFQWALEYYNFNQRGYWEDGKYILLRTQSIDEFAKKQGVDSTEFLTQINLLNSQLAAIRDKRIKPVTDQKILVGWNALTLSGLIAADNVLDCPMAKMMIQRLSQFLEEKMIDDNFQVWRNFNQNKASIKAFLEDYASLISAFIDLYLYNWEEKFLHLASRLAEYTIQYFGEEKSGMFFFSEANEQLIARKMDLHDNVLPSSNSIMAKNLYRLGILLDKPAYTLRSQQMLANISDGMEMYGSGYSNWADLYLKISAGQHTILIVGEEAKTAQLKLKSLKRPDLFIYGSKQIEDSIFANKWTSEKTSFYHCFNNQCDAPVHSLDEVLQFLN